MSSNNAPRPKVGVGATVVQDLEVRGDVTIGCGTVIHPKVRIYADAGPIIIGQNNIIEERTVIRNRYRGTRLFFDSLTATPVAVNNTYPNNSLDDSSDLTLSAAADQSFSDLFPAPGRRTSHGSVHYPDLVIPDSTGFFPAKNRPRFPQVIDEFDNSFQLPEVRGGRMTSSPGNVDIIGDCELEQQQTMVIGNNNIFEVGSYVESLQIGDYNVVEFKARVGRDVVVSNCCVIGAKCLIAGSNTVADNTVVYGEKCQQRQHTCPPQSTLPERKYLSELLPSFHYLLKPNNFTEQEGDEPALTD